MADDISTQIVLQAVNETNAAFDSFEGALASVQTLIKDLTTSFTTFASSVGISLGDAAVAAEELAAPVEAAGAGMTQAMTRATESAAEASAAVTSASVKSGGALATISEASNKLSGHLSGLKNAAITAGVTIAGGLGLFEFTSHAVEAGNQVYELSKKLHVSSGEAFQLGNVLNLTNTNSQAFITTITRLDRGIETAGKHGNVYTKALAQFGVQLTDAHGKLLPLPEQLAKLSEAYEKAAASGNEEAFSAAILGARGQQLIPMLADYAEAQEAASKVKWMGVDPQKLHEQEVNLEALKLEMSQVGMTAATALMPIAEQILPPLMNALQNLASFVSSHQSSIKQLIGTFMDVGKSIATVVTPVLKDVLNFILNHGAAAKVIIEGLVGSFVGLKVLGGVAGGLKTFSEGLDKLVGGAKLVMNSGLAKGLMGLFNGFGSGGLSSIFDGVTSGLATLGSHISTFVFGPWKLLGDGIRGLPGLVKSIPGLFSSAFGSVSSLVSGAFRAIPGAFSGFLGFLQGIGPRILGLVRTAFSWEGIVSLARGALTLLTGPWGILILAIMAGVGAIIANWDKIRQWVVQHFGGTIPTNMAQLRQTIQKIWTQIQTTFTTVWNAIKSVVTQAWAYIEPTVMGAVKKIQAFWQEVWPKLKELFVEVWHLMATIVGPELAVIYVAISGALGFIKGLWKDAWGIVKSTFKLVWDAVVDIFRTAWDIFSGVFNVVLDILTGRWGKAWDDVKTLFRNVWNDIGKFFSDLVGNAINWGRNIINGFIDGIKGTIGGVANAVGSVVQTVKNFLGFHSPAKEGPGSESDVWAPNLVRMFATGLQDNTDLIGRAAAAMISPLQSAVASIGQYMAGVPAMSAMVSQQVDIRGVALAGAGGAQGFVFAPTIHVTGNITKNEHDLANMVQEAVWNKLKMQGKF